MIKLPAYFTGFSSKVDKSAALRFSTQELDASEYAVFSEMQGQFGWLMFSPNEIDVKDMPTEQAEDKNKTPSKRLRATLFILWKQQGGKGKFDLFYEMQMEKFISRVKNELD